MQSDSSRVTANGDEIWTSSLEVQVVNNVLTIKNSADYNNKIQNNNLTSNDSNKVIININTLHTLNKKGTGNLAINGLDTDNSALIISGIGSTTFLDFSVDTLKIDYSATGDFLLDGMTDRTIAEFNKAGGGSFTINNIDCTQITLNNTGAGTIYLSGTVDMFYGDFSGPATTNLQALGTAQAFLTQTGDGNKTTMSVNDILELTKSGNGEFYYYGAPDLRLTNTGTGAVSKIEN